MSAAAPVSNGSDPYTPYASMDNGKGKGKGKDWPIVPESSTYGVAFVGVALVALLLSRYLNSRSSSTSP